MTFFGKTPARESNDLFEAAIERSPFPLVHTVGADHVIRYVNDAFCLLCEMDRERLIGQPLEMSVPGSADGHRQLLDKALHDGGVQKRGDLKHLNPAGDAVYWSYAAWPVDPDENGSLGLIVQVTDTSAQAIEDFENTRVAADIQDVNEALVRSIIERDEAAERADAAERSLRMHQQEIEELNHRLKRAITETHHRVKNNLQIIVGLIDLRLMTNEIAIPVDEVKQIGTSARTLAALHDILTADSKRPDVAEGISTSTLLEKLVTIIQTMAETKRIRAEIADIWVSPRLGAALALVVNELMNNAVKHGKDEVNVTLTSRGGIAALEVADNGPGFPAGFDSATGASTGLELVESLVGRDLCGEAVYENSPEGGARVTVRFPVAAPPAEPDNRQTAADDPLS